MFYPNCLIAFQRQTLSSPNRYFVVPYISASSTQTSPDDFKDGSFIQHTEEPNIDVRAAPFSVKWMVRFRGTLVHVCVCFRPSSADCVSRTRQQGCRRRNCSSYTERRYTHVFMCVLIVVSLCRHVCTIRIFCVCVCLLCGSTLLRRPCCRPVRS